MVENEPPESVKANLPVLIDQVRQFNESMTTVEEDLEAGRRANKNTRRLGVAGFVVLLLILGGFVALAWYFIDQNRDNARIACENANESRSGSHELWSGILGLNINDPKATPEEKERARKFQMYVDGLFAQRDCSDLDREYERPDFPDLAPR